MDQFQLYHVFLPKCSGPARMNQDAVSWDLVWAFWRNLSLLYSCYSFETFSQWGALRRKEKRASEPQLNSSIVYTSKLSMGEWSGSHSVRSEVQKLCGQHSRASVFNVDLFVCWMVHNTLCFLAMPYCISDSEVVVAANVCMHTADCVSVCMAVSYQAWRGHKCSDVTWISVMCQAKWTKFQGYQGGLYKRNNNNFCIHFFWFCYLKLKYPEMT